MAGEDIHTRSLRGWVCPECSVTHTSRAEGAFREFFRDVLSDVNATHTHSVKLSSFARKVQLDIHGKHNGVDVAIEYDGSYYHSLGAKPERDVKVTIALLDAGFIVVRIREEKPFHLDMEHPRLLQLSHDWSLLPADVKATGDSVVRWLESL